MAVDPRMERLPEHEGPAFRTWQLIMQTTMGSVVQHQQSSPSGFQTNQGTRSKSKFGPAEDFISLNTEPKTSTDKSNKAPKRKKENHNEETGHFTPWKTRDHYPEDPVGLHMEISDFYKFMSPFPEEESMRQNVVDRITALILNIWPSAKVEVFGSFRTKLYLPTSDIDLAVFGKWEKLPLFTLEKELINNEVAEAFTIKVLDKATVPIIKLTDKQSKIRVDISFNVGSSIESAELIKKSMEEFKILPALFITVKHFLVQRDLNEVFTGGISSYCLMLLMISFLQRHPRIDVRKKSTANLGVLLMEFFELYGRNFNYQRIAIKLRGHGEYANKEELAKELGEGTFLPLLCIEDPVTLSCDIGKSSYGILRVKEAFEYAFNVIDIALRNTSYFKINPNTTYLSRIITVPKDLNQYRDWIKTSYQPSVFTPKTIYTVNDIPSPLYQVGAPTQFVSTNNGRPPLLPTPTSPFSPRVNIMTPPFSPYPVTTNYGNAVGFFEGTSMQPTIIIPNVSTNEGGDIVSTQMNSLQLSQPPAMAPTQVRYVVPTNTVFTQHKLNENRQPSIQSYPPPSTQLHSPVKTMASNTVIAPLSNVLTSMVHQRRNNPSNVYNNNNNKLSSSNNSTTYYNKRSNNNNGSRNSQRSSPRTSPKLNSREFPTLTSLPIHTADNFNKKTDRSPTDYIPLRNNNENTFVYSNQEHEKQHLEQIKSLSAANQVIVDLVSPVKDNTSKVTAVESNVYSESSSVSSSSQGNDVILISSDGDE